MTKHIRQAIVATLCDHPSAEKYRERAKLSEADALEQASTVTKADLMVQDDEGRVFLDTPGTWKNFEKIAKIIQGNGDKFAADDFMKPMGGNAHNRTLLESARTHDGFAKVFTPAVWDGRFEEMERLWYRVPVPSRRETFKSAGLIPLDLKRQLLGAELPEDRLAKSGLTRDDIVNAMATRAAFDELKEKLAKTGDHLRKEYLMLRDLTGNTVMDKMAAWDRYESIVKELSAHGEQFSMADFTQQVSFSKNVLARAAEHRQLHKVFKPAHWQGRLPEMLELWSHVKEGWKTGSMTVNDFDAAYADAESLTYGAKILEQDVTKENLLEPLPGSPAGKPVRALGLKKVWDEFASVQAGLKLKNAPEPTIDDLRKTSGEQKHSCMIVAVKSGRFDKVADIAKRGGGNLTVADFMSTDHHGNAMINLLGEKGQLSQAFAAALWIDRIDEMRQLWDKVKAEHRHQINFVEVEANAKQATLKKKQGGGFKLKSRKK